MPKNPVIESIRHHLFQACKRFEADHAVQQNAFWNGFLQTMDVSQGTDGNVTVLWSQPKSHSLSVDKSLFALYQRGDQAGTPVTKDPEEQNRKAADTIIRQVVDLIGVNKTRQVDSLEREQTFHDEWAHTTPVESVMVRESFEACTAPENRFILEKLGDLKGKKVLDLGCGLGEAAVYFALQGADVTASDLSPGMLEKATQVAERYKVRIQTHQCSADTTNLPEASFDVVYAANVLHHSDIPKVLDEIRRILTPGGVFVSWDPLIHNPAINIYRKLAQGVRTVDEHPLDMRELQLFKGRFSEVEWRCFWLSTLLVFVKFYFWDRVDPSKERYWKKILTDSQRLAPLYKPLERLDRVLLKVFPWSRRYCWNIVVWCRR